MILLTLPALAFLLFVVFWSKAHGSSANFRIVKHEIAWETESCIIMGDIRSMKFEKVFCHRVVVNYPTPFLARHQPGPALAFLRLRSQKLHMLSVKTICINAKGFAVPRRQHFERNDVGGEATSETEYNVKDLRSAPAPLVFHVYLQWNDGSKPIDLPTKMLSSAVLKTTEGFSLDLNSP